MGDSSPACKAVEADTAHLCRRFVGKVAIITGSTAGIGLAIAERLGMEGAQGVARSSGLCRCT
jgi:3-oxoacyl-ACP reductase-like protein